MGRAEGLIGGPPCRSQQDGGVGRPTPNNPAHSKTAGSGDPRRTIPVVARSPDLATATARRRSRETHAEQGPRATLADRLPPGRGSGYSTFPRPGSHEGDTLGWLGSATVGRRPQSRGLRTGGSLAVASSTTATQSLLPQNVPTLNQALPATTPIFVHDDRNAV